MNSTPIIARQKLRSYYSRIDSEKLTSFQAAVILELESATTGIDWHSVLAENRREEWTDHALVLDKKRGNRHQYMPLEYHKE